MALHLSARLDAEVGKMASVFAMCANNFAARASLSSKGSGQYLEALLLMIVN